MNTTSNQREEATKLESQPTKQTVECVHCGLPAPKPRDESEPAFCCNGCRGAWQLIHGWGLEDFYALRDCNPTDTLSDPSRSSFEDLDDPKLLAPSVVKMVSGPNGIQLAKVRLSIGGLHCAACAWLIEQAPNHVIGWYSAEVQMHSRSVQLVYDPAVVRLSELGRLLYRIGYRVVPFDPSSQREASEEESRRLLVDVAIAGFCAANAMWIAVALYAGTFTGIAANHRELLRFTGVGLGTLAVWIPGRVFLRGAVASLQMRVPHMDLPVAVGLLAGWGASVYGLFVTTSEVYFDSIATLVFFLLIGRWIQLRQQHHAGRSIAALLNLSPVAATRVGQDGERSRVPAREIELEDVVRVEPGESIPVDGAVVMGDSFVDRSLLTGESRPVAISVGDHVEAGTDNLESPIQIRTTAIGESTRLGELSQAVAAAAASKTPIVQLANRIGGWFVCVVLGLAMITAIVWLQIDSSVALNHSVALLIVACPCALALATPLAIAVAVGRLAERRILVRSGESLEQLAKPGTVFFDKTGTLTQGRMQVTDWFGDDQALAVAAAIESNVAHPIARAVTQFANANQAVRLTATAVNNRVGVEVKGTVDGMEYTVGGVQGLSQRDITPTPTEQSQLETILASGSTPLVVLQDRSLVGILGVSDPLRHEAREVIGRLRSSGWQISILSGDHPSIVRSVAANLGVDTEQALGNQSPEQKLAAIQTAKGQGPVVMVGDGVNDAAALAAADVGVALRGGANASLAAAPILIGNSHLGGIVTLIQTARITARCIRENFAISISYNLIAAVLAMTGVISPLIAAILMPISSLTVLTMTLVAPKVATPEWGPSNHPEPIR
ncbi:heavy metal translocating P-type ATPase [Novipirellula artificiosorum]|uniref:Putative copper-importing P-type ATPase A n=1 Tax=Novipirellula artificiosorum TaxID=2528016 RepID=A0A5C6DNY8_9BACT|nr:heavy metal translocating P-type ATPase [Novipirellula artificiosorum]TWU38438.1 putative copper-importing P-type ATPase A [Novipirellula artificiosorum]